MAELENQIAQALELLQAGKVVAVPTETVYGLAADALKEDAVRSIFALKGRPEGVPLSVLIASAELMQQFAAEVPDAAYMLARLYWPGPLTIVLKKLPAVPDIVTAGLPTVGLRVPDHPLTLELLRQFGGGLAAPSANRHGEAPATSADDAARVFGDALPFVLDGGPCSIGEPSTLIDLSGDKPRILREGAISGEEILAELRGTS